MVGTETCDTIADGLATRTPDEANVRDMKNLVDDVVLVSEEQMLRAIEILLIEEHVLAEPAGAASTAALLARGRGIWRQRCASCERGEYFSGRFATGCCYSLAHTGGALPG